MATVQADILGVQLLREPTEGGYGNVALVSFSVGAYTASTDSGKIGGGGTLFGASTTDSLATILQNIRRDGKTVTLRGACRCESGLKGSTATTAGTFAVSSGNITFNAEQQDGTEIDVASGGLDRAIQVLVAYDLA